MICFKFGWNWPSFILSFHNTMLSQNLYKNCIIKLFDCSSQQNFLCIVTEHVLKYCQFTFPQYTRKCKAWWWISYKFLDTSNILKVAVVFMLFFNFHVTPLQYFSYPNLYFIWNDKKSRKWIGWFSLSLSLSLSLILICQLMINTMLYFL